MSEKINVLVVEDETALSNILKKILLQLGCGKVWICSNASCALETVKKETVDLVFMDLNIEGKVDGIQCAKQINRKYDIPICFATSYADTDILTEAMDVNTLNYIVKPYGKKDIEITLNLASILLKKSNTNLLKIEDDIIHVTGIYKIDIKNREVHNTEGIIKLSKKEFDLLVLLSRNLSTLVKTENIIKTVWDGNVIASSTLRETITRIRKKLPNISIKAVHGMGYQLE